MAKTAACPSCGAPVTFKSAASIFAVCEYCQSTLVRHDQAIEDIGKMAALVEDRSPLQLGTEGSWQGLRFALIGRIQLRYSQGLWNEWYLLFDDMRTAWLSEAGGEYVLTFLRPPPPTLPPFESITVGSIVDLVGRSWQVTNIEDAECIAGQGELPFKVGPGYKAPVIDLREGDNFATLDYSESPPLLFVGSPVRFETLKLTHLRDPSGATGIPEINVQAQVFRCPSCGAPMSARSAEIKSVGCQSCGAVIDTSDRNYQMLSAALRPDDSHYMPRLAIGAKGKLDDKPVEVIGFLVKRTVSEGITYDWREYLLAGDNGTYRWLTEYNGHWNVVDSVSKPPKVGKGVREFKYEDCAYKHFSTSQAQIQQVAGEFTWRVARGDTSEEMDYISPPLMLSRERTHKEISWASGRYVQPAEISAAFDLKVPLPEPIGIYANQPSPWDEKHRRTKSLFWKLALAALLIQLVMAFGFGGKTLLRQELVLNPQTPDETISSNTFDITGGPKRVIVRNEATLTNNWVGLQLALVNKKTGAAFQAGREISYYSGYDGGERWSEGSQDDQITFIDVPAGTYTLLVDPEFSPETKSPVRTKVEIKTASPSWFSFFLILLFLGAFPVVSKVRRSYFETQRWAESDYAPADDSDDDD